MLSKYAKYRPLVFVDGLPNRDTRFHAAMIHTNGGGYNLFDAFNNMFHNTGERIASHFQIYNGGQADQFIDTDKVAYAAYDANPWCVMFEFEDDDDPTNPLTRDQINTFLSIATELGVPGHLLTELPSHGVGYHEQFRSWNKSYHQCPGAVREAQLRSIILPSLRDPGSPIPLPPPVAAPPWPGYVFIQSNNPRYDSNVKAWQSRMADRHWAITADGLYGPKSAAVCAAFEKQKNLPNCIKSDGNGDGIVGAVVWTSTWSLPVTIP